VFLRNVGIYLRVHKASHPTTSSSFTLYSIVVNIGLYVPPALVIGNCVLHLCISFGYFLEQHKPVALCNSEVLCSL
jgi:hypothetical protein